MQESGERMECPFCGGPVHDLGNEQIALLRASFLSCITPAVLHSARHRLQAVVASLRMISRELAGRSSKPTPQEILKRGEEDLSELSRLITMLSELYHMPEEGAVVRLRDLPERIAWVWQAFGLGPRQDYFAVLQESKGLIRLAPYWCTLTLALQAALVSLRRDREPALDIDFRIGNRTFVTQMGMRHHGRPDTNTLEWRAFRLAARHAGGTLQIVDSGGATSVEWDVPLINAA